MYQELGRRRMKRGYWRGGKKDRSPGVGSGAG